MVLPWLFHKKRRVRRRNAILLAQPHDLVPQFGVFAVEADLLQQVADLPAGPEAGDEAVLALPIRELDRVREGALVPADVTAEADRSMPRALVTPKHQKLRAGEEIGQSLGHDVGDLHP